MATPTFTLPAGVDIQVSEGELSITYDGDIVLEQDLGRSLGVVRAGGDLTVRLPEISGDLQAGGTVTCSGTIRAVRVHGRNVVLGDQSITCRTITADETISIGAATLKVDAIVAPAIHLDPTAKGRVTVVESNNERGASKIKGGFSFADYDDMFGNAQEFLSERGIAPLDKSVNPAPSRAAAPPPAAAPPAAPPPPIEESAPPAPEPEDEEEDTDDPLSLSLDDLEPLMEQAVGDDDEQLHAQLSDALNRITSCYAGGDLPPAVEELSHLIQQNDYATLRANITEVWNGLLGFHQQRGIRPNTQVTHAFNVIHNLVQV